MTSRALKSIAGIFALLCGLSAQAQTAAKIVGAVKDQNGKPVPGASIDATGQKSAQRRKIKADSAGGFVLAEMPPDTYQITATCENCGDGSSIVDIGAADTLDRGGGEHGRQLDGGVGRHARDHHGS